MAFKMKYTGEAKSAFPFMGAIASWMERRMNRTQRRPDEEYVNDIDKLSERTKSMQPSSHDVEDQKNIEERDFREKVKPVDNMLNRENSIASQGSIGRIQSWAEKQFGF